MKGLVLGLAGSFLCVSLPAADLVAPLNAAQKAQMEKGTQVLITESVDGKPWPRVKVYRVVDASAEDVAAVFFDYEKAKNYVPNLLKSDLSKRVSATAAEVDYGVDVPILPDEFYTVRNSITRVGSDGYRFEWKLIRAVQTKDSEGSLEVQPYDGKSLVCYQNLVTPGSSMAGLLKGKAVQQMCETVAAIGGEVEKQKRSNPKGLQKQTAALRAALGQ